MEVYKFSLINHFKVSEWHLTSTIILIIGWAIIFGFDASSTKFLLIFWLIVSAPSFYLHAEYYFVNRNSKLTIYENVLSFESSKQVIKCNVNEISKVVFLQSKNARLKRMRWLAQESYSYANFICRSGESFVVTNLMAPKFEKILDHFESTQIERQNAYYSSVFHPVVIPKSWNLE